MNQMITFLTLWNLKLSQDSNNSFPGKYDNDQINEIIYGLYEDYLHSDKNDIGHYHYIATLIDFICSDKFYENNIEACDMVTEFPIE